MFLQQSPKKERTKSGVLAVSYYVLGNASCKVPEDTKKLTGSDPSYPFSFAPMHPATLSAPPNMLAFRSPQAAQQQAAPASSPSNGPSANSTSTSSNIANTSSNTANTSTPTSDSSTLFLPSMDHQQYPQKFPSLATPQAKSEPTQLKPESPKKKSTTGPRTLTPSAIQQQHHSHAHTADNANTSLGSLPTSAYLPGSLPGVSTSLADLPGGKSSATTTSSNRQPKIPQSKRAPQDPYSAPGVSFRSSLRPPASAQIPDIPYGEGMVPRPKRPRAFSGASSSVATSNGTATAGVGSGVKARVFTPSDAHTNIRVGEDTPTNRQGANYTSRNMAGGQPVHQIVASSPATAQARASAVPKGTLVTPSAPLTVNAPVVPAKDSLVTSLDPQHIENFKQSTPQPGPNASPSKQPVKSAMKAKSWADLVRPMSNVHIAQEAVKNVGFTQDQVNSSAKKRVSIALPSRASDVTSGESTPTGPSRAGTPSDQLVTTRVPTHSSIVTAEGNDKSPHHRSPPPEKTLDAAIQAGQNGDGSNGDIVRSSSPAKAASVYSNFTAASGGSNQSVLNNMMAKQRSLDDLLAGVETSQSRVTLYPRGLVNTGNACFMNSILQTLLFTAPFYNLISLIGAYTSEDLSGRTPLLDAMVSYLSEFKTSNPERESQLGRGESYEEQLQKNDAFIPSIIYHALNNNARFAQMGFSTGSASASGINHSYSTSSAPLTKANLSMNTNHLSQEDAQEFLGFFLDTIHEELLIKTEAWDKQRWEKANRGIRAGMDSLARQSVNSIDEYENSLLASQAQAPQGMSNPAPVTSQPNGAGADSASVSAAGDDEWLEVGQKGRTATTRTTQTQESAVTRIFGGKLRSVLRCPGQKDSVTLEPFMSLQLEIQPPQIHTVTEALEAIAEPETLHDVTNRQNLKVEATKQVFIESLPPILILHLKRFIYDARAGVSKSHKIISYGTELEIPKECIAPSRRTHVDKRRYRLTGVVFHHGKTASGGHYSVCCRQNNGRWVNIDDTTISPISAEDAALDRDRENLRLSLPSASSLFGVPEKSAYLLFYQRL